MTELPFLVEFAVRVASDYPMKKCEESTEISQMLKKKILEENLDFSMLKEDVDVEIFNKTAYFSISGKVSKYMKIKEIVKLSLYMDDLISLIDKQIDFMKKHFYK